MINQWLVVKGAPLSPPKINIDEWNFSVSYFAFILIAITTLFQKRLCKITYHRVHFHKIQCVDSRVRLYTYTFSFLPLLIFWGLGRGIFLVPRVICL